MEYGVGTDVYYLLLLHNVNCYMPLRLILHFINPRKRTTPYPFPAWETVASLCLDSFKMSFIVYLTINIPSIASCLI